jgi:hypothetical protein
MLVCSPVFIMLKFPSHQEAWNIYKNMISNTNPSRVHFRLSWIKSSWYRAVAVKEREVNIDRLAVLEMDRIQGKPIGAAAEGTSKKSAEKEKAFTV